MPRHTATESTLASPFLKEELLKGINALKNNKAAGLDDMLCEQIKTLWTSYSTMAVEDDEQHIGNTEVPKDMEEVKSDSNTEAWKRLYTTKEL